MNSYSKGKKLNTINIIFSITLKVDEFSKLCSSKDKRKSTVQDPFRAISLKEQISISSDAAYKTTNEKSSFNLVMHGNVVNAGVLIGSRVAASKKAET
ncbi:hypothetical protein AAC387_Pa01g0626 [Persea americana]